MKFDFKILFQRVLIGALSGVAAASASNTPVTKWWPIVLGGALAGAGVDQHAFQSAKKVDVMAKDTRSLDVPKDVFFQNFLNEEANKKVQAGE